MGPIFDYLERRQGEMLEDLRRLVELESPTTDKAGLDAAADFIVKYATDKTGGEPELISRTDGGNQVAVRFRGDGEKQILVLGHFDTVWPVGTLKDLPFRVENGSAYGPGVFDMKGGLVQGLWAMRAIQDVASFKRPVTFFFNSDEEVGSLRSRSMIEEEARKSGAALVLEPSQDGRLKTSRKGAGTFRVKVTGKAAHAGLDPTKGISAIDELSRMVLALHSMTNLAKGTTLNVGVVHGGTRPNVVAQQAAAEVDVRVATGAEAKRVVPLVLGLKPHDPRALIEIEGGVVHPPMERTEETGRLFAMAKSIAGEMGVNLEECSVGGASDGNFTAALGTPTLDGLGAVGGGAHATDEHLVIKEMPFRAALVARLLLEI